MMTKISYSGYRFPPEIIQQAIWLYVRFTLSFRDVEDLLAERGIVVSYETVRRWVNHFGPMISNHARKWHLSEIALRMKASAKRKGGLVAMPTPFISIGSARWDHGAAGVPTIVQNIGLCTI